MPGGRQRARQRANGQALEAALGVALPSEFAKKEAPEPPRCLTKCAHPAWAPSPRGGVFSAADDGAALAARMLPPRACAQLAALSPPLRAVLLEEASAFALETLPQSAPLLLDAESLPRLCAPLLDWLARGDAAQCTAAVAALSDCEACHAAGLDWATLRAHGVRMKALSYCPCGVCAEPRAEAVRCFMADRASTCVDGCTHTLPESDALPLWGLARRISLQEVVGFIAMVLSAIHNRLGEIPQHMDAAKLRVLLSRISLQMREEDSVTSGAWAAAEAALRAAPWPPRGGGPFSLAAARRSRPPQPAAGPVVAAAAADWVCAACGGVASASVSGAAAPVEARRCAGCAAADALDALPLPLPADFDDD